ncbi:MAG: MBL fold metallo-hydrolase [Gemmatimonadota bacterium]|nr:MBL fold metallo-hydrolase [Gemmatimonadota bacterium]
MQVTFLGTSAAPSMPNPLCACDACSIAREAGGKNLRRRSSIVVNDDLMVDFGPDIATASFHCGICLTGIEVCLLTHAHEDHFDPEFLMARHKDYGTVLANRMILAGSIDTLRSIDEDLAGRCPYGSIFDRQAQRALGIDPLPLEPFEERVVGNYRITGYPGNHGTVKGALLYAIEQDGQAIFYGTDTSVLPEHVWEQLLRAGTEFDLLILDHTYGVGIDVSPPDHLAAVDVIGHVDRFRRSGLLKDNARVYATHISHEGYLEHDEFDAYAAANGYRIAYDGLSLAMYG